MLLVRWLAISNSKSCVPLQHFGSPPGMSCAETTSVSAHSLVSRRDLQVALCEIGLLGHSNPNCCTETRLWIKHSVLHHNSLRLRCAATARCLRRSVTAFEVFAAKN
jgi:hypothetical protein